MFRTCKDAVRTPALIETQNKEESHSCPICNEGNWVTDKDVEIHIKNKHKAEVFQSMKDNPDTFCTVCMRNKSSPDALIMHIKMDHLYSPPEAKVVEKQIYVCDYCNNVFFHKDMLSIHIQHSHSKSTVTTKRHRCPVCSRHFKFKYAYFHFLSHGFQTLAICPICLCQCSSANELSSHVKTHPWYYSCETCQQVMKDRSGYNHHLDTHEKVMDVDEKADGYITRCFVPKKDLFASPKYNIQNCLRGLQLSKVNICVLCRYICLSEDDMKSHISKYHLKVKRDVAKKKYVCICGADFFNAVLLKHHIFKLKGHHRALEQNETPITNDDTIKTT